MAAGATDFGRKSFRGLVPLFLGRQGASVELGPSSEPRLISPDELWARSARAKQGLAVQVSGTPGMVFRAATARRFLGGGRSNSSREALLAIAGHLAWAAREF